MGGLPPVVKNLLIINGLMLLLKITMGLDALGRSNLDNLLGLHVIGSPDFRPWQLLTHMFMHAGPGTGDPNWFLHIIMNMFALFMFGGPIERRWGAQRFLKYYLICGLGAGALQMGINYVEVKRDTDALAHAGVDIDAVKQAVRISHDTPGDVDMMITQAAASAPDVTSQALSGLFWDYSGVMVGASGAVFGILLAFGMMFPNVELMLLFLPIPIKAKYFVALYGLFELQAGIKQSPGDNIAHFAHLGGMLFGYLVIRYWKRREPFL